MKFQTHYNRHQGSGRYESNYGASKTVPDQSMGIRELLVRHTRGLPLPRAAGIPIYDNEDPAAPNFRNMDLAEIEQFQHDANEELLEIAKKSRTKEYIKKKKAERLEREKDSLRSKPNQGTQALGTSPTEAESTPKT